MIMMSVMPGMGSGTKERVDDGDEEDAEDAEGKSKCRKRGGAELGDERRRHWSGEGCEVRSRVGGELRQNFIHRVRR